MHFCVIMIAYANHTNREEEIMCLNILCGKLKPVATILTSKQTSKIDPKANADEQN